MIDRTILEKTLEFILREGLVSSYFETRIANVPIFVKVDNTEKEIEKCLIKRAKVNNLFYCFNYSEK